MVEVSNPDRIVFPEIGRSKADVVAYYEQIAPRALPHVSGRPLSIRRYPRGLAGPGFFQKNVPPHYPQSIERFPVPRSPAASKKHPGKGGKNQDVTVYPILRQPEDLAYLANQGAIELHVPTSRAADLFHPDRLVIDLDPPPGQFARVRRAAYVVRDALAVHGRAPRWRRRSAGPRWSRPIRTRSGSATSIASSIGPIRSPSSPPLRATPSASSSPSMRRSRRQASSSRRSIVSAPSRATGSIPRKRSASNPESEEERW